MAIPKQNKSGLSSGAGGGSTDGSEDQAKQVRSLLDRLEVDLEKMNHLYNLYGTGIEALPPRVQRNQLDQLMNALTQLPKTLQVLRFRYQTVHSRYMAYIEKWDRLVKKVESGAVQRVARPQGKKTYRS